MKSGADGPQELSSKPRYLPSRMGMAGRGAEICPSFLQPPKPATTSYVSRKLRILQEAFFPPAHPPASGRPSSFADPGDFLLDGPFFEPWFLVAPRDWARMTEAGANWKLHNIVAHLPEIPRGTMEQRGPAEFILEAFADPGSVREVVKGEFFFPPPSQSPGLLSSPPGAPQCDFAPRRLVDPQDETQANRIVNPSLPS